jgi:hypothetical protein
LETVLLLKKTSGDLIRKHKRVIYHLQVRYIIKVQIRRTKMSAKEQLIVPTQAVPTKSWRVVARLSAMDNLPITFKNESEFSRAVHTSIGIDLKPVISRTKSGEFCYVDAVVQHVGDRAAVGASFIQHCVQAQFDTMLPADLEEMRIARQSDILASRDTLQARELMPNIINELRGVVAEQRIAAAEKALYAGLLNGPCQSQLV